MSQTPLPPRSLDELLASARTLEGTTLLDIAAGLGTGAPGVGVGQKGKAGELLERALGATGGSRSRVDFPELGVELKSIPTLESGAPLESTFVCAVRLDDAERAEWSTSWAREKLRRVLFVPLVGPRDGGSTRRVGKIVFWQPTHAQDDVLQGDFDEIMGLIGAGSVEDVSAHLGRYLQLRPKARDGSVRTHAFGADGERISTVPRGFYLRPSFTGALLVDTAAVP